MKVLSLFDGISCARVALERAGIPVDEYYASEIDRYAIQISQKNYPDIVQLGSVTDLNKVSNFNLMETLLFSSGVDLLIGGSPCQDLSIAKKDRKGLDGERSGLFWEYVRILKEVKPRYFILENVASMPKEAKAIITEALGVEPVMINAALVSAQNRKRLFWVGKLVGDKYEQVYIPQPEDRGILLKHILEPKVDEIYFVKSDNIKMIQNPITDRIATIGKGGQGDRIYSTDNKSTTLSALGGGRGAKTGLYAVALTETRTELAKQLRKEYMEKTGKDYSPRREKELQPRNDEKSNTITTGITKESLVCIVPEATKKGYAVAQDGDSIDLSFPNSKTRRGRVGNKVKNIMTSQNIGVFTDSIIRKLTPIECERLQSLPDNYTEGTSNSQRYKVLGNAFNVDVVAHILKHLDI